MYVGRHWVFSVGYLFPLPLLFPYLSLLTASSIVLRISIASLLLLRPKSFICFGNSGGPLSDPTMVAVIPTAAFVFFQVRSNLLFLDILCSPFQRCAV